MEMQDKAAAHHDSLEIEIQKKWKRWGKKNTDTEKSWCTYICGCENVPWCQSISVCNQFCLSLSYDVS